MSGGGCEAHARLVAPVGEFIGQQELGQVIVGLEAVFQQLDGKVGKLSSREKTEQASRITRTTK